jgi:MFS transporter, SP family, general alpha glucoside:H+ symporter
MILVVVASISCWPTAYAIAAETSSLRLRARAQGISWFSNSVVTCVIGVAMPYVYNPDAGNLGAKSTFVFVGITGFAAVGSFLWIPETKGRTAGEIDQMYELKLGARDFSKWQNGPQN